MSSHFGRGIEMILSDNETKFDLLNNEAIAKTVVNLIKESNNQPISIGIHGDWGAGKSSILEMIEDLFNHTDKDDGKKYCCIRFNGWKHQGFEDSKIALMSAIVSELTAKENLQETAKEILGKLWKNINWMTVAKTAGKTALGIATGTAPIAVLSSVRDMLKSTVTTQEGIANAIDVIGGYLEESKITEDTSSNTEFTEFHKNFKELLEKANIKKLVVLIDDLDRCLPDVAINTLEAVRLFMFTGETDVQKILKDDYAKASNETLIATQIGHLLSHNTDGNPRKIKRFINMLLLRFEIAKNRGFGAEIDLAILAKMMLAEYYFPNFYEQLPAHLTSDGVWKDAKTVKDGIENEPDETVTKKADVSSHNENWFDPKEIKDWILLEPDIMDVDLRPYYYACKEKIDYFAGRAESSDLSEIVDILLKSEMVVTQYIDKLKGLTEQQSEQVFGIIAQRIMEKGNFENKPDGIDGLRILVQQKNSLRRQLADFIAGLPKTQVGVWVTNGWNKAIPSDCSEHSIIDKYFEELKTDGNPIVQGTLKAVRRKDVIGHIIS